MKHPAMKGVVVREVQQYLHRPGLQPKAVYAGVIFLNQVGFFFIHNDDPVSTSHEKTHTAGVGLVYRTVNGFVSDGIHAWFAKQ